MKIRNLSTIGHYLFRDLSLCFVDPNNNPIHVIIFAGENGSGKSTLLKLIYDIFQFQILSVPEPFVIRCEIELSEEEIQKLAADENIHPFYSDRALPVLFVEQDYSNQKWSQFNISFMNHQGKKIALPASNTTYEPFRKHLRIVFSEVEINYVSQPISNVTASDVDQSTGSERGSAKL